MFCKKCGHQLDDGAKFCINCGTKVGEDAEKELPSEEVSVETGIDTEVNQTSEQKNGASAGEAEDKNATLKKVFDKVFLGGLIAASVGVIVFLGIVLVSLIGWGEVYLFGGYDFLKPLVSACIVLMIVGAVAIGTAFIANLKLKSNVKLSKMLFKVVSVILVLACIVFSVWGVVDCNGESGSGSGGSSGGSSGGGSYGGSYNSGLSKTLGLSLKVDSIKTSSSYTYVYCTVKNVSSTYNLPTKYRYVKVKALFKNYYGSIVDTDWTYAVDSTWLEPGESKTFYFMVRDTSVMSADLSFAD